MNLWMGKRDQVGQRVSAGNQHPVPKKVLNGPFVCWHTFRVWQCKPLLDPPVATSYTLDKSKHSVTCLTEAAVPGSNKQCNSLKMPFLKE